MKVEANLIELGSSPENQRGLVARTVETYPPAWITVHETLQNSIDAIQQSTDESGNVHIHLNLDDQKIKIRDTGKGFPFNLDYLGLGGTDKSQTDWHLGGNIGVGLTVVILSTNYFKLNTVFDNKLWQCEFTDAFKYLLGEKDTVDFTYEAPITLATPQASYTEIEYSFPDDKILTFLNMINSDYRERVSNKFVTNNLEKFKFGVEHYFRTHSYAGNVSRLSVNPDVKPVHIQIYIDTVSPTVIDSISDDEFRELLSANNHIEIGFENKYWDIIEAIGRIRSGISRPAVVQNDIQPGGRVGGPYGQNYIYVKTLQTQPEFESLLNNPHLRNAPNPAEYQRLFDQLESIHCIIGSIPVLSDLLIDNTSQFIAASGIPSAHLLDKPSRGGELGYLSNLHLILNVRAKLNYGKQTITNTRLVSYASKYFNDAFRSTLKNIAKEFVGSLSPPIPPQFAPPTSIVTRRDMGLSHLSIIKEPMQGKEHEVIALFYELIGQKYFTEYKTYALSSRTTYDARMMIKYPTLEDFQAPTIDDHIPTLEFKVFISDLISNFEEGDKKATDLSVVIAWDQDYDNSHPDYEVIGITGTDIEDYGLEHINQCLHQRSSGHYIQLLILKDVIAGIREGNIVPH